MHVQPFKKYDRIWQKGTIFTRVRDRMYEVKIGDKTVQRNRRFLRLSSERDDSDTDCSEDSFPDSLVTAVPVPDSSVVPQALHEQSKRVPTVPIPIVPKPVVLAVPTAVVSKPTVSVETMCSDSKPKSILKSADACVTTRSGRVSKMPVRFRDN